MRLAVRSYSFVFQKLPKGMQQKSFQFGCIEGRQVQDARMLVEFLVLYIQGFHEYHDMMTWRIRGLTHLCDECYYSEKNIFGGKITSRTLSGSTTKL